MSSVRMVVISTTSHLVLVHHLNFVAILLFVTPATIMGTVYAVRLAIKYVPTILTQFFCFVRREFSTQRN